MVTFPDGDFAGDIVGDIVRNAIESQAAHPLNPPGTFTKLLY
jgi:hypothetical protein